MTPVTQLALDAQAPDDSWNVPRVHIFEAAGLGVAPFKHVGEVDMGRACRSCQYCGTTIRYCEYIRDANGREFFVGNECVHKTGDQGLVVAARREATRRVKFSTRGRSTGGQRRLTL